MKRSFDRLVLYSVVVVVLVILGISVRSSLATTRVAFVDIGKMVEEYNFKKQLEQSSAAGLSQIRQVIDSLQMLQKIGAATPRLDTQLAAANYAFRKYYEQSNQEITKKIWDRLNPLMEQYGKEHDLQLLIGATGTGNVLYGSKAVNVTEDLTRYINTRFEKGN